MDISSHQLARKKVDLGDIERKVKQSKANGSF